MAGISRRTPRQLARALERGQISPEAFREAMQLLQLELLTEAVEVRRNPVAAYLDKRLAQRAITKLLRSASEAELREVLFALGDLEDFAPAQLLWNADQDDIPLYVFIRTRLEPVFRITYLNVTRMGAELSIEYGAAKKKHVTREDVKLERTSVGELVVASRHRRS